MASLPTRYQVKRAVIYPRVLYGRRKERHQPDFMRHVLDLTNYRKSSYDFIGARMLDHGILHDIPAGPGSLALDVGAYLGTWATAVSDRFGCSVLSFELSPTVWPHLAAATRHDARITAFDYGLGSRDELVQISRRGLGSSVYDPIGEQEWDEGRLRDVAGVWAELGLDRVAAMKINIEGGEYDLLERMADTDLLDRVDCFLIQFHEWIPGAYRRRRGIRQALARTHEIVWDYPFVWEKWHRRGVRPSVA